MAKAANAVRADSAPRLARFALRVGRRFLANRGILLASGVGYNALLSAVPLLAVVAWVLSAFYDERALLETFAVQLQVALPQHAETLVEAIKPLLAARHRVGAIGFLVLVFFSALAFRTLAEAFAVVFSRSHTARPRALWRSALLAYGHVAFSAAGILVVSALTAVLVALGRRSLHVLGFDVPLQVAMRLGVHVLSFVAMALLFTSIYKVLPPCPIGGRRALAGGVVAAALWAGLNRVLFYWFTQVSLVNVIYGSLATVVVVLLAFEAIAVVLLLGGQVIAELEASAAAGVRWFEEPA